MIAADVMRSDVVTVRDDATVADAIRLMLDHRISGLPVLDASHRLAGILTEGDFLRRTELETERTHSRLLGFLLGTGREALDYVRAHGRKVAEVMTRKVVTAAPDTKLPDLVRLMERHRVKHVPVVRDGAVLGIVTRADLLRALSACLAAAPVTAQEDVEIRRQIVATLQRQNWAPALGLDVDVQGGVVFLRGVLFDDRLRGALKVVAENVPGVKSVQDEMLAIESPLGLMLPEPGGKRGPAASEPQGSESRRGGPKDTGGPA